jgi:APA family basic amino acid/polyamine antiporter
LKLSARVLNALTVAKVLALGGIVAAAFTVGAGSWHNFAPLFERRSAALPLKEALGLGLIGVFYSFGGFWEAARVAGEVRDAPRILPRALAIGVAAVTAAYLVTTVAFLYLVPPEGAQTPAAFARNAGEALFGAHGPAILAAVVVLSVLASAAALLLMAPRLYLAMSRDGLFPADLAEVHPRTGSPILATGLLAGLATIYVVSGKFPQIVAFFMCPTLVLVALAAAGLFRLRRREPESGAGGFRAPGFPVTPALFVLLLIVVAATIVLARPFPALAGLALVAAGIPFSRLLDPAQGERS